MREIADACRRQGLKFGVYLSPWDRNHATTAAPHTSTTTATSCASCSRYGPLFEVWFDGANGGDGYYGGAREKRTIDRRTYYDWDTHLGQIVRELQPDAVMFSDAGPDVRWVGNEKGIAGDPCWATLNRADFAPGEADEARLNRGDRPGTALAARRVRRLDPARLVLPRREDDEVKTPDELLDIYYESVGRGACSCSTCRPTGAGRSTRTTSARCAASGSCSTRPSGRTWRAGAGHGEQRARARRALRRGERAGRRRDTYWATDDGVTTPELVLDLGEPVTFDVVSLREYLPLGQRVEGWALDAWQDGSFRELARGTSIGSRRLWRGDPVTTSRVRLRITQSPVAPAIAELALHREPQGARRPGP